VIPFRSAAFYRGTRLWRVFVLAIVLTMTLASAAYAQPSVTGEKPATDGKQAPSLHISAHGNTDMAYDENGDVWYWGGMLDYENNEFKHNLRTPMHIGTMEHIAQVDRSNNTFLKEDGTVWLWPAGMLPDPDVKHMHFKALEPEQLTDLSNVSELAPDGLGFNAAIKNDGSLWVWKSNLSGLDKKIQIPKISGAVHIVASSEYLIITEKNGTVWELKTSPFLYYIDPDAVTQISGLTDVNKVVANPSYGNQESFFAIKNDGSVWGWGSNSYGQLGLKGQKKYEVPEPIPGLTDVSNIYSDLTTFFATKNNGSVWGWGNNEFGQLGLKEPKKYETPTEIPGLTNISSIHIGEAFTSVLKKDGTVWSLGLNRALYKFGWQQVGNDSSYGILQDSSPKDTFKPEPERVESLDEVVSISGGYDYSLAVKKDGTLWGWGANQEGNLGDGTSNSSEKPIQIKLTK
jgi:alpha-tubulin suppressor-like RCC1 family protein